MLASYAKMADDDSLRQLADRIQARAVRRMGELLKQFDGRGGDQSKSEGAHTFAFDQPSQKEVAERAAGRIGPTARSNARASPYFSSWPNILPVFRLIRCSLVQARQVITSYSFSGTSSSSSSQCCTFIDVAGQVKTTGGMVEI